MGRRGMGKASFIDLSDADGRIQVMMRSNVLNEDYEILDDLDIGDWIGAEGTLFRTRTGQITLQVATFSVLCKSLRPLPEKWHGLTDVETRFRQRYLDLISNADAIKTVRLTKGGFPARFGGRLSSVLQIDMKEGNMKEFCEWLVGNETTDDDCHNDCDDNYCGDYNDCYCYSHNGNDDDADLFFLGVRLDLAHHHARLGTHTLLHP